jgi:hypothetical protein
MDVILEFAKRLAAIWFTIFFILICIWMAAVILALLIAGWTWTVRFTLKHISKRPSHK